MQESATQELGSGAIERPPRKELRGHLAEVRTLLCLSPSSGFSIPLQPSHIKRCADALGYRLRPSEPTDLGKLWCAVSFATAPTPIPWKPLPAGKGFQNILTGAVSEQHPLLDAYRRIRGVNDEPPAAKLSHLQWWEFAPAIGTGSRGGGSGAGDGGGENTGVGLWPAAAGGPPAGSSTGGTWLCDMVTGARAGGLEEALPSLPFISSETMPAVVQEPTAAAVTSATFNALTASGEAPAAVCERLRSVSLESRVASLGTRPLSVHTLHAAAIYLGISLRTHPHLMWIASAALCTQQPPLGWTGALAADGQLFYFHPVLGAAQYEHPSFCYWRAVAQYLR